MSQLSVNEAFSKLLIHNKLVNEAQAQENMAISERLKQLGINIAFSDLLVERGVISAKAAGAVRKLVQKKLSAPLPTLPVKDLKPTPAEDRKFGKLLVHNGLITDETLRDALATQKTMREEDGVKLHLGEILVGRGAVHLEIIESVLELHRAVERLNTDAGSAEEIACLPTQHQDLQFAQLAIDQRLISAEQVQDALRFQRELHGELGFSQRLGAILLAQDVLNEEDVRTILETQADFTNQGGEELEIFLLPAGATEQRMAKILAKHELAPAAAIEHCLQIKAQLEQLGLRRNLGEVLLMRGYINHDQLQPLLKVQRETNRINRRQMERKVRDRARERRQDQEEKGTVPKRLSSRARQARSSARRSGAMSSTDKGGRNPALIAGGILVIALLVGGGVWAMFAGPGKAKSDGKKDQQAQKADASKKKPSYIKLKNDLKVTGEEMEMLSPSAAKEALKELEERARKLGYKDLVALALKLKGQVKGAQQRFEAAELTERVEEIDGLLAKQRVLDAGQVLADVERYFEDKLTDQIKTALAAVGKRVATAETQAIKRLRDRLDKALAATDWETVNNSLLKLEGYGSVGRGLVKVYEKRLKRRKKEILDARLAAIRQKRRNKGHIRLRVARKQLAVIQAAERAHLAARTTQGRTRTAKRPQKISLRDGRVYTSCKIEQVHDRSLTFSGRLRGKQVAGQKILWTQMTPRTRSRVMPLTFTDKDSQEYLALGKLCITNGLYDDAQQLINQAVALDPKLLGKVPNVSEYRKPTTFASGKIARQGEKTTIHYTFDREAELEDFGKPSKSLKVDGGMLKISPRQLIATSSYSLRPAVELMFKSGQSPPGGKLLIHVTYLVKSTRKGAYIVINDKGDRYLTGTGGSYFLPMLRMMTDSFKLKKLKNKSRTIRFLIDKQKIGILVGEDSVFSEAAEEATDISFSLMGYSRNPDAFFEIDEIKIVGNVPQGKYDRVIAEKRAWKLRQMDDANESSSSSRLAMPQVAPEYSEQLTPSEGLPYREMLAAIATYLRQPDSGGRYGIVETMERFEKKTKTCPAFYFYRGWFRKLSGKYKLALADFDRAVELEPNFHEALARKAEVLARVDRMDDAAETCRKALALQPDYTFAMSMLAKLKFYRRKDKADGRRAIREMQVAAALAPKNRTIRMEISQLQSVLKGPPWPGARPIPRVSQHYSMQSDLPEKEAKQMLDELEAIDLEFRKFMPPRELKIPKGYGYIFATQATYSIYSELTTGSQSHNTLGYYSPRYRQLHLFKDQDDSGTKKVALTADTLRHEAWHMYVDNIVPTIPRWLNEGIAEYFGAATIVAGKPTVFGLQEGRLEILQKYLAAGAVKSTKELMAMNATEFMTYDANYPHAWALVYMCMVHYPNKYKTLFMSFVEALRKGQTVEEARDNYFSERDFIQLDRDFKVMLKALEKRQNKKKKTK